MNNVIEMKHPLIQHKISRLRDKNTGTAEIPCAGRRNCYVNGI